MESRRNVLIVYAHHNNKSFNSALLDTAVDTLEGQGCDVTISDLYLMNYDPIIGRKDIKGETAELFHYTRAAGKAYLEGHLAKDIQVEQNKLSKADLIIFQFPIQWSMIPAILKGWIERTFIANFSQQLKETGAPKSYDEANFVGKKAVICLTTGATKRYYSNEGRHGDIDVILYPFQSCVLQSTGFSVLKPQLHHSLDTADEQTRKDYLDKWRQRLQNIWTESPLHCIPNSEFDGEVLLPHSSYRDLPYAPSTGTHLGKNIKARL